MNMILRGADGGEETLAPEAADALASEMRGRRFEWPEVVGVPMLAELL